MTRTFPSLEVNKAGKFTQKRYNAFARDLARFLNRPKNRVTISATTIKLRGTHKVLYTLRLSFNNNGDVRVNTLNEPIPLAGQMNKRKIQRIELNSGVKQDALEELFRQILFIDQPLQNFNRDKITIVLKDESKKPVVLDKGKTVEPKPKVRTKSPVATLQTVETPLPSPPSITEMDLSELVFHGKNLNKQANKQGLSQELAEEIKVWIEQAKAFIDVFKNNVTCGWTRELVGQYHHQKDLSIFIIKLQGKIGVAAEDIEIPQFRGSLRRLGVRTLTKRTIMRHTQVPQGQPKKVVRPRNNFFVNKDLGEVFDECRQFRYLLQSSGTWAWSEKNERNFKQLIIWLRYLLHGNNLENEYLESLADLSEGKKILEGYRKSFQEYLKQFNPHWSS